jgi:hypothetical protein
MRVERTVVCRIDEYGLQEESHEGRDGLLFM